MNGTLKYYDKNGNEKNTIILVPGTKARKVGQNEATIRIPGATKDYILKGKNLRK